MKSLFEQIKTLGKIRRPKIPGRRRGQAQFPATRPMTALVVDGYTGWRFN